MGLLVANRRAGSQVGVARCIILCITECVTVQAGLLRLWPQIDWPVKEKKSCVCYSLGACYKRND